ncbi:MAG: helix-turn-helix transcriptional regulator [Candidatus Acidiferrum sp.]|jgi:AraC-like DNA-binding protein
MLRRATLYETPSVERLETANAFFDVLLPKPPERSAELDWRVEKLQAFIYCHPGGVRRSIDNICRYLKLPVSERHARRLFKAATGMGIRDYVVRRRLTCAVERLQQTNTPIKVIAADLGYEKTGHLSRSFKKFFRLGPVEFRRMWRRQQAEQETPS